MLKAVVWQVEAQEVESVVAMVTVVEEVNDVLALERSELGVESADLQRDHGQANHSSSSTTAQMACQLVGVVEEVQAGTSMATVKVAEPSYASAT